MAKAKVDKLDLQIIDALAANARVSLKDVAEELGVSRAVLHLRVQRLTEQGVLQGSGYNVNYKMLGFSTYTYVGVTLERGALYGTVLAEIEKIPEITECHYTTGPYAMLVKLYARDNDHLMKILRLELQQIDGVVSTETLISLEQSFKRPFRVLAKSRVVGPTDSNE